MTKLLLIIAAIYAFIQIVILTREGRIEIEPEPKHPVLKGNDLKEWTEIYKSLCILYQRTLAGDVTIASITWDRWSEITGKEQWIKEKESNG